MVNLFDDFGLNKVAHELLYFDIGYLPFSLIAGNDSYYPGPGTLALEINELFYGFGLMVYLISLNVVPKS